MAPSHMSLWDRDIPQDLSNAKNTFSSWDGCMSESYCKYPVIIAIIVVSLIVLSIVFCIVRCCCCGLECCCGVCSCFNACCPSPRQRRERPSKYADPPGPPGGYNNTGYQSHPPPSYNAPPQYAHFDVSRKCASGGGVHEDALPAMPSWDTATSHRVPDESHQEESHEMNQLGLHDEQNAPMLAHQAPSPGVHGDSFMVGAAAPSPYHDNSAHASSPYNDPYTQQDQQSPLNRYGQGVVAAPAGRTGPSPLAQQQSYTGHSPYGQYNQAQDPYGQGYGQTSYGVAGVQAARTSPPTRSPSSPQGYGPSSPSSQQAYTNSTSQPATALPSALQSGGAGSSPVTPSGYQGYGSAYSQATQKSQYTAYNPSEVSSTRYEPSSYGGSTVNTGMRRPGQTQSGWHDV